MFKMTPNVLRNLLSKKATRRYPYVTRPSFENVRGTLVNEIHNCTFCGVCAAKCPSQCIRVDKKSAGWSCDPFACVYCGVCVEVCPAGCLQLQPMYRKAATCRETMILTGELKKKELTTQKDPVT